MSRFAVRCVLASSLLAAALCAVVPSTAAAYHDEATPSLEENAYHLRSHEWLLGPFELGVGLWRFQLSTRTLPWILGAALGKAMPNLKVDFLLLEHKKFTLSAASALYYVNSHKLIEGEDMLSLFLIPTEVALSYRVNDRHTVSGQFKYVRVTSRGSAEEDDIEIEGASLSDSAQLQASWEWRLSRISALLMFMRYAPFVGDPVLESAVQVDERTTAEVDATVDSENTQHSVAGGVAGVFSWKHFNLRAGVTYGALFVSGPGLIVPLKYPYPDVNLYWRL